MVIICRYFSYFFYCFVGILKEYEDNSNYEYELDCIDQLNSVSRSLGRPSDIYYRLQHIIPMMGKSTSFGPDHIKTLTYSYELYKLVSNHKESPFSSIKPQEYWEELHQSLVKTSLTTTDSVNPLRHQICWDFVQDTIRKGREMENPATTLADEIHSALSLAGEYIKAFESFDTFKNQAKAIAWKIVKNQLLQLLENNEVDPKFAKALFREFCVGKKITELEFSPELLGVLARFEFSEQHPNELYSSTIYAMAKYQLSLDMYGHALNASKSGEHLSLFFETLGFNEELENFMKFVHFRSARENKLFLTSVQGDDCLPHNLYNLEDVADQFLFDSQSLQLVKTVSEQFRDKFGNMLYYKSLEDLLDNPPDAFIEDGIWTSDVLCLAKKLFNNIMKSPVV